MSSPGADFCSPEPCEFDSCHDKGQLTFYCVNCDCSFCDTCWDKQPAHKPKKRGFDGHAHEKIDRLVVERYRTIFESPSSIDEQDALYKDEEDATWFGIGHNRAGDSVFEDYGRFTTLMAESLLPTPRVRYPHLVSFIGQTGAGKSAVVKLLINYQDMKVNRTAKAKFSSPLVGSVNDNIPVSADVHLYADPHTILTDTPLLYADCEGLEGGESPPKNELYKMRDRALENRLPHETPSEYSPRTSEKLSRKRNKVSRKISWALGDKEKSKREFAVTELYPKVLYTFSDVVVFVLRNPKTFESAVLQKLIAWASESYEKSLGQPALPHVIIVINATDLAIDASQWDVTEATRKFLSDVETSIERIPALQAQLAFWRAEARSIKTTKDLLECYYSSITVVRIPAKGRYMLMDEQVAKLHTEIVVKCSQSHYTKKKVHMLSNSEDLQLYLQLAFDHFSQNLDDPFNFVKVALKINPIPSDFSGNILKLAVAIKDHHQTWTLIKIFEHLSLMVASCIMLDIDRHRRLGTPKQLLDDYYMSYCEQAFAYFCDRHWPCNFMKRGLRCANPYSGHAKGHQNANGKMLAKGAYDPSFSYGNDLWTWTLRLEREINNIQVSKDNAESSLKVKKSLTTLHLENIKTFYGKIGSANNFQSHCTCFCCLREIPIHPLACGHILCSSCVRSYGVPKGRILMEVLSCPICQAQNYGRLIKFMPPLAGVRILCLDGGGMRGIVELEVLKAIEEKLPPRIPVRNFFDLIVGTSTGGIIALGLGVEGWSVDECIKHFENLCDTAFTPREFQGIWGLERLSAMSHNFSKYKTKPLEEALKAIFSVSDQPLYGGQHSHYHSSVKVAVTSATEIGENALLLANYNRSQNIDDQASYSFERAEKPEEELNVWEAARATSAAPSFFKPFRSKRSRRGYLDGALYHNNPVRVADLERRLIWPDSKFSPPDILLSIGTSCNSTTRREAQKYLPFHHQKPDQTSTISGPRGAQEKVSKKVQTKTQMGKVIKIMKNRVENILDTEIRWVEFMSDADARGHEDTKKRHWRINPDLMEDPPALDDVQKLPFLRRRMHQIMKHADFQKQIGEIARRLVASSFYLEVLTSLPKYSENVFCAEIQCKFPSASQELRHLGDYFKNMTILNFQPYFIIGEKGSTSEPIKIIITQQLIQGMTMNASFEVGPVLIPVSTESAITTISLSTVDGEELPISGLPRALIAKNVVKELSPSSEEPGEQIKLGRASWHENFVGDGTSSHTGESSHTSFPELRRLSEMEKLPIRNFLQEQLSKFQGEKGVSRRMWLLAEAVKELDDDDEDEDGEKEHLDANPRSAGGFYDTILHTACLVGNYWLVKLQIEAGVDVSALNQHSWTALMVATAQGHTSCADLLSEHMETMKVKGAPQAFPPSGNITVDATSSRWFTSDHPIPPHFQTFYYEIEVPSTKKYFGIFYLGLIRIGSKQTNWAYDSTGEKFCSHKIEHLRYSGQYDQGDTVGCGIDMQTGKIFFTKNGRNLGIAFGYVKGVLFPGFLLLKGRAEISMNFGESSFVYDIAAHDWAVGESAADIRAKDRIVRPNKEEMELHE